MQIVHVAAERCQRIVNSPRGSRAGGILCYFADLLWRHAGHCAPRLQPSGQRRDASSASHDRIDDGERVGLEHLRSASA